MMRTSLVLWGLLAGAASMAYGADAPAPGGGEAEARSACASRVYPPNPPNDGILFVDHAKNNRSGHLGHALVQYAPGKILAFYPNCSSDHGGHSAVGWMEFKRSEDGGQTWSDPQVLAFSKELYEKNEGQTAFAEKAVVTDKGEIVLFYLVCDVSTAYWRPFGVPLVSRSTDAGKTWSEPKPVTTKRGRIYDAIYQDGEIRVLHFANDATNEESRDPWTGSTEEHVYELHVSTDGGQTFSRHSELPLLTYGRGYGSLGQLGESELIAYVYNINNENVLDYVISRDGGKTWPKSGTSTVSRKIRNPQFIAFGGKYYLHGRSGHSGEGSRHMILYMSEDGVTWDEGVYLRMAEAGLGAYSNSIVVDSPDGSGKQRLLIQASHAYENHKTNVLHWWLESATAETPRDKGETLYNGIVLPQNWPPGMDSQSDDPMPVPYLKTTPKVIPIDLGRQLFVDDFLVEKTDMERVFHKPVVHEQNPVLTPLRK